MTRIISGQWGGRRISVPGRGTRPTADRAREGLFNRLEHAGVLPGARVLDLYAGSGALGLEALSRGADEAVLVESDRGAVRICRANVDRLHAGERARVVHARVERYLTRTAPRGGFDLVLADPPYDLADLDDVLTALTRGWLAPGATVVLERPARAPAIGWPEPLHGTGAREYGQSVLWFADYPL